MKKDAETAFVNLLFKKSSTILGMQTNGVLNGLIVSELWNKKSPDEVLV